jgi:hypothetical protein
MKYLLMITDIDGKWDTVPLAEQEAIFARHNELMTALQAERKYVTSLRLRPPREARTVRLVSGDGRTVTDGPFTETKEVMGGFYVVEADSMDEAIGWAKRIPLVYGSVEVRQAWD